MNSQILKLEAPYNIIYAGGRIGRHIATMTGLTEGQECCEIQGEQRVITLQSDPLCWLRKVEK